MLNNKQVFANTVTDDKEKITCWSYGHEFYAFLYIMMQRE